MTNEQRGHFRPRIVESLDSRIRASTSHVEKNVLFAQKAFALARYSAVSEAKDIITALRQLNQNYETRLSAWIMFSEGVIEYSDTLNLPKSKDRILRGHLIGQVANDPSLAGTSAAWLAFFCFQQNRFREAGDYLEKALRWTTSADTEARARAYMVLGMAYLYVGDTNKGKLWMHRARQPAISSGDIAMQNIIFCNTAAYFVSQLTLDDCTGTASEEDLRFAAMSSQSAGNMNSALGIVNQESMLPLQRAELQTIERQWPAAIAIFDQYIEVARQEGQIATVPKFLAQRAWCHANMDNADLSNRDIQAALDNVADCVDPDDCAILHFRISQSANRLGDKEAFQMQLSAAEDRLAEHRELQTAVLSVFGRIADTVPEK